MVDIDTKKYIIDDSLLSDHEELEEPNLDETIENHEENIEDTGLPEPTETLNVLETESESESFIDNVIDIASDNEDETNELDYKELYETSQVIILELNKKIEHLEFENKNNLAIIEKFKSLLNN